MKAVQIGKTNLLPIYIYIHTYVSIGRINMAAMWRFYPFIKLSAVAVAGIEVDDLEAKCSEVAQGLVSFG